MTPDEKDAYLHSLWNYDQDNGTNQSGYYNSDYAQQVFAMVNQERADNGVAALTWDSDMASYSDRRVMEITTDFSHNSAGGEMNVGENYWSKGCSISGNGNGWMDELRWT